MHLLPAEWELSLRLQEHIVKNGLNSNGYMYGIKFALFNIRIFGKLTRTQGDKCMKNNLYRFSLVIAVLLAVLVCLPSPVGAEPTKVTVVGEINDQYQIVDKDNNIYEIADTELGDEVIKNMGAVVEVAGELIEEDGVKVIDVKSFKVKEQ
jgi:hypothetical protein